MSDKQAAKSNSQKVLATLRKELKKLNPHGASQCKLLALSPRITSTKEFKPIKHYNYDEFDKDRNPALNDYFEQKFPIKDIHRRLPDNYDIGKRGMTQDPFRVSRSPTNKNFDLLIIDDPNRRTPQFEFDDKVMQNKFTCRFPDDFHEKAEKYSPNIAKVNDIIANCDDYRKKPDRNILPKSFKKYTKEISDLVIGIDNYLLKRKPSE